MKINDPFGLQREAKISKSRVRDVFTPNMPIATKDFFFGRTTEVNALIGHLNTPGQHALLYGDRGVGKSSLANITSMLLELMGVKEVFRKRCDSTDSFRTIVAGPLTACGINLKIVETERRRAEGGEAGLKIPGVSAGIHTQSDTTSVEQGLSNEIDSPGWVATVLGPKEGLFVIDEVDVLQCSSDRHKLAELIKHLSDAGSKFKILLVGISETGADLIDGHPSVQRCLRETRLARMKDQELRLILERGEKHLKIRFTADAKRKIVALSSGYPHFTHLLALKAAEDAIGDGRTDISVSDIERATERAVGDSEGRLKRQYDDACRSTSTENYRRILCAAAVLGSEEFRAGALREQYQRLFEVSIDQGTINNYLQRLVSPGDHTILRRIAKGVYRFNDPRMPSLIRIANMNYMNEDKD